MEEMIAPEILNVLLEHYPVLRELPPHLLEQVQREGQYFTAPAGEMLFNVGSPCQAFTMLIAGQLRVERLAAKGRKIVLFTVKPGDCCIVSVSCLLGNSPYPAMGTTGSELSAVKIPRHVFLRLIEHSEAFRTSVFRIFSNQIVDLMEFIEGLAWEKMSHRLAQVLISRPDVFEATHQMLADELGSVREVVSRTLKEFESLGFVKLGRGQIHILNRAALLKTVEK